MPLALLCLAGIAAGVTLAWQDARHHADPGREGAGPMQAAQAASQALNAELQRRLASLAVLAAAPAFDRPGEALGELDRYARAAAALIGAPVVAADASLAQLVDTAEAFGTPLPGLGEVGVALQALESRHPVVGEGDGDASRPVVLAIPVEREQRAVAVVASAVDHATLERILAEARPGAAAVALMAAPDRVLASIGDPGAAWAEIGRLAQRGEKGNPLAAASAVAATPGWQVLAAGPPAADPGTLPLLAPALLAGGVLGLAGLAALPGRRRAPSGDAAARHRLAAMRRLNDTIPVGLALLDRDLRFVSVNARFASITGLPGADHLRRAPREVLPPAIAEALTDASHAVLATGEPVIEIPIGAEAPGEIRNERHYLVSCHPAMEGDQRVGGVSVVVQDVTERVRAERARELLVRELNHRVKNTLATVQSIVASTLRQSGEGPTRIGVTLGARLQALARAHDLLTARDWQVTDLGEVVRTALAPWLQGAAVRIAIDGPAGVPLRPAQAQAVVLALHELATNAVKYGALSTPEGRIGLVWEAEPGQAVRLRWIERGGPPVEAPPAERRGFGTRLLERALAADLGAGASVRLDFVRQGLQATISFEPRGRNGQEASTAPVVALPPGRPPPAAVVVERGAVG